MSFLRTGQGALFGAVGPEFSTQLGTEQTLLSLRLSGEGQQDPSVVEQVGFIAPFVQMELPTMGNQRVCQKEGVRKDLGCSNMDGPRDRHTK